MFWDGEDGKIRVDRHEGTTILGWRLVIVSLIAVSAFLLGGHLKETSGDLRSRALTIVDDQGHERIVMRASQKAGAELTFFGARDRRPRMIVHSQDDGVDGITIYDPNSGAIRLSLGVSPEGNPIGLMFDEEKNQRVVLGVFPNGEAALRIDGETTAPPRRSVPRTTRTRPLVSSSNRPPEPHLVSHLESGGE
jgi:hypothetical protein